MTTIEVTQHDIAEGIPETCKHCPLAIAIARKLPAGFDVSVMDCNVSLFDGERSTHVSLPASARSFIQRFDKHIAVTPFSFDLDLEAIHA